MKLVLIILVTQALYATGDLFRKIILGKSAFDFTLLKNIPFVLTLGLSAIGVVLQLYALKHFDLSRTIILLGTFAVIFSTALGVLVLKERFSPVNYLGVLFAVLAIIFINLKR